MILKLLASGLTMLVGTVHRCLNAVYVSQILKTLESLSSDDRLGRSLCHDDAAHQNTEYASRHSVCYLCVVVLGHAELHSSRKRLSMQPCTGSLMLIAGCGMVSVCLCIL